MPASQLDKVIHYLHKTVLVQDAPDGQLLESFISRREEAALEALVRRHAPMVWGVCRRVLGNQHDAEDAFQATFLVLVRKAASIVPRDMVGNWLHGVAHQTALNAKASAAKRKEREKQVTPMPEPAVTENDLWRDLQPLFDEELRNLPDKYRAVILLCDLQNKTRKEAAEQLGLPEGTVAGRLARARIMLAKRLGRRGLAVSGGSLAAALAQNAVSAGVPAALVTDTVKAMIPLAAGYAAAGIVSARVAALAQGVLQTMFLTKFKVALVMPFLIAVGLGVSILGYGALAAKPPNEQPADTQPRSIAAISVPPTKKPAPGKQDSAVDHYGDALPDGAVARLGTVRFRHEGEALALSFAAQGKALVGYTNSGVLIWDAATGKEQQRVPVRIPIRARGLDVSPDGTTLAVPEKGRGDGESHVSLWDLRIGKKTRTLSLPKGGGDFAEVHHVRFSSDGKSLAVSSTSDGKAVVLDLASGQVRASLGGGGTSFYNLAVSPDCKTLAVAVYPSRKVQLWDIATGKLVRDIHHLPEKGVASYVRAIGFSPDGKMLAFGTIDRIFLSDPATRKELGRLEAKMGQVTDLAFTPDSKTLVSGSEGDGKARVWDVATGKVRHTLDGRMSVGRSMALSPDGSTVALGTVGHTVRLWDVASGKELFTEFQGHDSQINSLAYFPDGKILASAGDYQQIRLWDTTTNRQSALLPGSARTLSFSPDGKKLATVAAGHSNYSPNVRIWDVAAGKDASLITIPDAKDVKSAIFSPDGRKLFTLDWNHNGREMSYRVRQWGAAAGKQQQLWAIPHKTYTLSLCPDGQTVVAALDNGIVSIYDAALGRERLLRGHESDSVQALAQSPDARVLATGTWPNSAVRLWEVLTGKEIGFLKGHNGPVSALAWSPDGRLVASGDRRSDGNDMTTAQTVRLYDTGTAKEVARFGGFKADVTTLIFTPDGTSLAVGLADSTILIWDVAKAAPKLAARKLGQQELESCWADLAADDASKPHQAIWTLIAAPQQSVPFLRDRLKPVVAADAGKIQRWIADLESGQFPVRQTAAKELEKLGEQAESPIQKAMEGKAPVETRRRLENILTTIHGVPGPATLRNLRAIMVLERIGSPEAIKVLDVLAHGTPTARETREAKTALERLDRRAGGHR